MTTPITARDAGSPDIATPDEVLETFTQLMRSEKTSEQLKAAEQLAKYHSLFTPREEATIRPELIAEINEAVRRIQAGLACNGSPADTDSGEAGRP